MTLLSINHGAKGVVMWTWPTSPALEDVTGRFAKVATGVGAGFWLGANSKALVVNGVPNQSVNAAAWIVGGNMLVSIVNVAGALSGRIVVSLPNGVRARAVRQSVWGGSGWAVSGVNKLVKTGMGAVESDVLIINLAGGALDELGGGNMTASS